MSYTVSPLHFLALKYFDKQIDPERIRRNSVTAEVYSEIKYSCENKVLINWQFLGLPATGKSVSALALCSSANEHLGRVMDIKFICRDQTEFGSKVRDESDLQHVALEVDEWNELEETGFNATTEDSFLKYFSDIQAQRMIHRFSCSPQNIVDKNSYVLFYTISMNKENKTVRSLVYYRLNTGHGFHNQLIGHADINVAPVLESDWYKEYVRRKFQKMDLVTKEGVQSPRELKYAGLILDVVDRLRPAAKLGVKDEKTVKIAVRKFKKDRKIVLSIIGERDIVDSVCSMLNSIHRQESLRKKIIDMKRSYKNNPQESMLSEIEILQNHHQDMQQMHADLIGYWKDLVQLNKAYEEIDATPSQ